MPFFELSKMRALPLVEGITIKAVYGEKCSASFLELAPMSRIPEHHHENEQIGIVIKGEIEYTIGNETKLCRQGDAFIIPPNTHHTGVVVSRSPVQVIDMFTPPRDLNETLGNPSK